MTSLKVKSRRWANIAVCQLTSIVRNEDEKLRPNVPYHIAKGASKYFTRMNVYAGLTKQERRQKRDLLLELNRDCAQKWYDYALENMILPALFVNMTERRKQL